MLVAQTELCVWGLELARGHQKGAPKSEMETQLSTSELGCLECIT